MTMITKSKLNTLFSKSNKGYVDSLKYNLSDFIDNPDMDQLKISDRICLFDSWRNDLIAYQYNHVRRISMTGAGPVINLKDHYTQQVRPFINLASNDYLNLATDPAVISAGVAALKQYGAGAGSVPLLGGTHVIHKVLEKKIAKFKACEHSLLFTSGFGANSGVLNALLRNNDVAILDMYVHASILDGCKNKNKIFFRHNNLCSLEKALEKSSGYINKLVVVDGVYSMDGDIAKLDQIVKLAHCYNAMVMVDEAHATGVIGALGKGTPEYCNIEGKVDIISGTFSKGLGAVGGFIAGSKQLIHYLELLTRTFMFSTALPPSVCGSVIKSIDIIINNSTKIQKLWSNIEYFRKNIIELGFNIGFSETAIFPIIIGDSCKVFEMCKQLHQQNIYVNSVVFPAVPKRLSRIRITITAELTKQQLDTVLEKISFIGKKLGII